MKWEPIETVPKDGTVVDIWIADKWAGRNGRMTDVQWLTGAQRDPDRCGPGGCWEHLSNDGWAKVGSKEGATAYVDTHFTHWMIVTGPI